MIKIMVDRFNDLSAQLESVEATRQVRSDGYVGSYEYVDSDLLLNWCVKARSLISAACGKESEHYKSFGEGERLSSYDTSYDVFKRVRAVFFAAKEDFEGGYLISVRNLVHAEIADSELDQSKELLEAGYIVAAAVIAGVVLETILRTLCGQHGLAHGKLDKMNADLVKVGRYNVIIQKRVTALAGIRNSAAHGKGTEFKRLDVEAMIADIERMAADFLS